MSNFYEIQFPSDISYGSSGGPEYLTNIVATNSGQEHRQRKWQRPRCRYNVIHGVKTTAQMQELLAFFRTCQGRAVGFRFKDWSDYTAQQQLLLPIANNPQQRQLCKVYQTGAHIVTRIIHKPVAGSVVLYQQGQQIPLPQEATIDITTGIITFAKALDLEAEIYADFEFDVPVRFDSDILEASLDAYGVHSCRAISLVEVKI